MNTNSSSETSAAVKRRRRGVDWTVMVQLVAIVPSLVDLGIVVLVTSLLLGSVPDKPEWTQWARFGAAVLWFLLGFMWFAPFLRSFLAQSFFAA